MPGRVRDTLLGAPPALLPWQGALLAAVAGILAIRFPVPAFVCLIILLVAWTALGGLGRAVLFMPAAFGLGLFLAWARLPAEPLLPECVHSGRQVLVQGVVDEVEPRPGKRFNVILRAVVLADGDEAYPLPGRLAWSWHSPTLRPVPGTPVSFRSSVGPVGGFVNPGAWDYAFYQRTRSIFTRTYSRADTRGLAWGDAPTAPLDSARRALLASIHAAAPGQGGALAAALLTGDRFHIAPQTQDLLRAAGLSHTLALSGLHLGFLVLLAAGMAWLVGVLYPGLLLLIPRPRLAVLLALPLVAVYLWVGSFSPSLVRAACMFAFWGLLLWQGRGRVLLDGLFLALAVILLFSPLSAFDIRLQLSAVAVAGISIFLPALHRGVILPVVRRLGTLGRLLLAPLDLLGVSLCATISLLPLTAHVFGMAAPNLLLNLLWIPVLGMAAMPLGILGAVLVGPWPELGARLLAWDGALLGWMLQMVGRLDGLDLLPRVQLLRPLWPEMLGCALLMVSLAVCLRWGRVRAAVWPVVCLGLVLMAMPHLAVMYKDATLATRLEVVDIGAGQALVITVPGGGRTVVDGGGLRSLTFDAGRDVLAPFLTFGRPPRVDKIILSHAHADHYKGLMHLLRFFRVGSFYSGDRLPGGRYRRPFREALEKADAGRTVLWAGDRVHLDGSVSLSVVHPEQGYSPKTGNDASLVLLLEKNQRALALLPADVEAHALASLLAGKARLGADVLLLPHHGSGTSFSPQLYRAVDPLVTLVSAGNSSGRRPPVPEVRSALSGMGLHLYATWRSGMLRADWEGDRLSLSTCGEFSPLE